MIYKQLINDTSGTLMSGAYAMASGAVRYTAAIPMERDIGRYGLFLQMTGSIALTREVSFDKTEWVTPYNELLKTTATLFTLQHGDSSGYYSLYNPQSTQVIAPWVRFVLTAPKAATITTFQYISEV